MAATDHFFSIDSTLASIRAAHAEEMQRMKDALLRAELEATMQRDRADSADKDRAAAERIAQALITQFGTVAIVFGQAKKIALDAGWVDPNAPFDTPPAPLTDNDPSMRSGNGQNTDGAPTEIDSLRVLGMLTNLLPPNQMKD